MRSGRFRWRKRILDAASEARGELKRPGPGSSARTAYSSLTLPRDGVKKRADSEYGGLDAVLEQSRGSSGKRDSGIRKTSIKGGLEAWLYRPWQDGDGTNATVLALAQEAGVDPHAVRGALTTFLSEEDKLPYSSENEVDEDLRVGTRIRVEGGDIVRVDVGGESFFPPGANMRKIHHRKRKMIESEVQKILRYQKTPVRLKNELLHYRQTLSEDLQALLPLERIERLVKDRKGGDQLDSVASAPAEADLSPDSGE